MALRPYADADIRIEQIDLNSLVPLAKYVMAEQLRQVRTLDDALKPHNIDVFALTSGMVWPDDQRPLAPPVVEEWKDEGLLLVDGLHRAWVARERSRRAIACVIIRRVAIPLMPLPVTWDDVKIFEGGEPPLPDQKRNFRFLNAESLRRAMPAISEKVTEQNYQYFLYRNLDEIGSAGVRQRSESSVEAIDDDVSGTSGVATRGGPRSERES